MSWVESLTDIWSLLLSYLYQRSKIRTGNSVHWSIKLNPSITAIWLQFCAQCSHYTIVNSIYSNRIIFLLVDKSIAVVDWERRTVFFCFVCFTFINIAQKERWIEEEEDFLLKIELQRLYNIMGINICAVIWYNTYIQAYS